jgi:hypothetical protein
LFFDRTFEGRGKSITWIVIGFLYSSWLDVAAPAAALWCRVDPESAEKLG